MGCWSIGFRISPRRPTYSRSCSWITRCGFTGVEGTKEIELTVSQEKRRNGDKRFFLTKEKKMPFDWAAKGGPPRWLQARCARRPIERHSPFVLHFFVSPVKPFLRQT